MRFIGMAFPVLTTSNGSGGGDTFIAAGYAGSQQNFFSYWFAVTDPEDADGEYRNIYQVDPTGEFTLYQAFSAQVLAAAKLELLPCSPDKITEVLNQAMSELYPALHTAVTYSDPTFVIDNSTEAYEMPEGITPDLITKIMVEGDGVYEGEPFWQVPNPTYSSDGQTIYFNRLVSQFTTFDDGKLIYIFYQDRLNPLQNDGTYGAITHDNLDNDEVGVLLVPRSNPWELFMLTARAIFYEMLAGLPTTQNPTDIIAKAARFRAIADKRLSSLRPDQAETAGYV